MGKNIDEVKNILEEYKYGTQFKKYSLKLVYKKKIDKNFFGNINSNIDVEKVKQYIENTINRYRNIYPLVKEDKEELELELAKYEIAVHKVIQCYNTPNCNFNYSKEELMELINNCDKYEYEIGQIDMRRVSEN